MFNAFLNESLGIVKGMRVKARTAEERRSSRFRPLHHHFHEIDLGTEYVDSIGRRVVDCLATFESSEVWRKLREVGAGKWGPITTLRGETPKFTLENTTVYSKFDLWFKNGKDVVIIDWKSGKRNRASEADGDLQLAVYALYGRIKSQVPRRFFTQVVWLSQSGDLSPKIVSEESIEAIQLRIRTESAAELALLSVKEFKSGRKEYIAERTKFPPNPSVRRCCECKYHTICPEGLEMTKHLRQ